MATKLEKAYRKVRDASVSLMISSFKEKFGIEITSHFNIIDMVRVSGRVDELPFLPEHIQFIEAFEAGYFSALALIGE